MFKFLLLTSYFTSILGVAQPSGKIINGVTVNIVDYPYQLELLWNSQHLCGATTISTTYAITAGHCTYQKIAKQLSIRAGTSFRNRGGVVRQVAQYHQHPKFNISNGDYDISILRLAVPLEFGSGIQPAKLPARTQVMKNGEMFVVTGWGYYQINNNTFADQLQGLAIPKVDCSTTGYTITKTMFCAGYFVGLGTCGGDSGGPLVNKRGEIVGLVTGGTGCTTTNLPGVYTSVIYLRSYVRNITGF